MSLVVSPPETSPETVPVETKATGSLIDLSKPIRHVLHRHSVARDDLGGAAEALLERAQLLVAQPGEVRLDDVAGHRGSGARRHELRSVHIPDDETCFHFFEAASAEAVGAAGKQAGLVFDRITEALA